MRLSEPRFKAVARGAGRLRYRRHLERHLIESRRIAPVPRPTCTKCAQGRVTGHWPPKSTSINLPLALADGDSGFQADSGLFKDGPHSVPPSNSGCARCTSNPWAYRIRY